MNFINASGAERRFNPDVKSKNKKGDDVSLHEEGSSGLYPAGKGILGRPINMDSQKGCFEVSLGISILGYRCCCVVTDLHCLTELYMQFPIS